MHCLFQKHPLLLSTQHDRVEDGTLYTNDGSALVLSQERLDMNHRPAVELSRDTLTQRNEPSSPTSGDSSRSVWPSPHPSTKMYDLWPTDEKNTIMNRPVPKRDKHFYLCSRSVVWSLTNRVLCAWRVSCVSPWIPTMTKARVNV